MAAGVAHSVFALALGYTIGLLGADFLSLPFSAGAVGLLIAGGIWFLMRPLRLVASLAIAFWVGVSFGFVRFHLPAVTGTLWPELFTPPRSVLIRAAERLWPEPEAGLALGLTLGVAPNASPELSAAFKRSGLSHIIVLSGYNLSVVAAALGAALSVLGSRLAAGGGLLGLVVFTGLAGGAAATVRAALMAGLGLMARLLGRDYHVGRAFVVALLVMIVADPTLVAHNIGFELSALATAGLIYLTPLIEPHLTRVPESLGLRAALSTTLGAELAVVPWLWYRLGTVSLIAPLANTLVLPLVPPAMFFSGFAVLCSLVPVLGAALSWAAYPILRGIVVAATFFGGIPGAALTTVACPLWLVLGLYGLLGWWAVTGYQRRVSSGMLRGTI